MGLCRVFGNQRKRRHLYFAATLLCFLLPLSDSFGSRFKAAVDPRCAPPNELQVVNLRGDAGGKRFDGIGIVNGGGATSVLLKDYPEPQRSQILDYVFKPKFGASVSALLVEIPGDGNSTQGSMPSHMHTRNDLNYRRGYMWWILQQAKKRNPHLTLDGTAWSAPGWVGNGRFWSQDAANYYIKWLQGLRKVYGLELDAIGCRNEKGVSFEFAKMLRATLNANGFEKVKLHGFDNWQNDKFDFIKDMIANPSDRDALDILSAHTLRSLSAEKAAEVQSMASKLNKPIWDTEEHVYKSGFDDEISIVEAFNQNFINNGATKIVNWYDIAGVYPIEPYSETPSMLLARSPWSGTYQIREALWGYAHYGQFSAAGWQYLNGGSGALSKGGTFITLKAPNGDYSIIFETKPATTLQRVRFQIGSGLSSHTLCVWRSNSKEQFVRQPDIRPRNGTFVIALDPDSIYSLSTTTGQRKGSFKNGVKSRSFPFPYYETFDEYTSPKRFGYLPHYTADIAGSFEIVDDPKNTGKSLRQMVPVRPISWAPEWMPYTILGDDQWRDYQVSADVYLNPGDSAGIMGRINDVGSGYGAIPKGYFLQIGDDGNVRLVVIRGKTDKATLTGDAEQQALIKSRKDDTEGGEKVLAEVNMASIHRGEWHNLKLSFDGSTIKGSVDGRVVVRAVDSHYGRGMVGLLAGSSGDKLSTPYFDNILVMNPRGRMPSPAVILKDQVPIYAPNQQR